MKNEDSIELLNYANKCIDRSSIVQVLVHCKTTLITILLWAFSCRYGLNVRHRVVEDKLMRQKAQLLLDEAATWSLLWFLYGKGNISQIIFFFLVFKDHLCLWPIFYFDFWLFKSISLNQFIHWHSSIWPNQLFGWFDCPFDYHTFEFKI